MKATKKPEQLCRADGLDTKEYTLTGDQYNSLMDKIAALQDRIAELETINDLLSHELNASIWALTQCHLDMPSAWSRFLVENNYRSLLPDNVRIRLRHGLKPIQGGFPRVVA